MRETAAEICEAGQVSGKQRSWKLSRRILVTLDGSFFWVHKNIVYACSGNEPVTASYHDILFLYISV